jgi:hypothetical protein
MAIQDPKGAYLLGWTAEKIGDNWMFTNAPATNEVRPRAAMWDGVGTEGFQVVRVAAAPSAVPDELTPGGSSGGGTNDGGMDGGGGGGGGGPDSSPPSSPGPGGTPPVAPPPRAPGSPGRPPGSSPPGGSIR